MARIRTIKPDFFKNEGLAELPALTRLLFIGLWTQADREGRLEDRPKRLKIEIFPYENCDLDRMLNELQSTGFVLRYKVNANGSARILAPEQPIKEVCIIQILNFLKHQKIDKVNEKESSLPPIDYNKSTDSLPKVGEGKGILVEESACVLEFFKTTRNFRLLGEKYKVNIENKFLEFYDDKVDLKELNGKPKEEIVKHFSYWLPKNLIHNASYDASKRNSKRVNGQIVVDQSENKQLFG